MGRARGGHRRLVGTAVAIALAACGGGGGGDDGLPPSRGVTIEEPADGAATGAAAITLRGRSFIPDGSRCDAVVGTIAPGYTVRWRNAANGAGGAVDRMQLNCLLAPSLTWEAFDVPLAAGTNAISVEAVAADGERGRAGVTVRRR